MKTKNRLSNEAKNCIKCKARKREAYNKVCSSCRMKEWRRNNPDKIKAYLERTKEHREKYMDDNREKVRIRSDIRRYGVAREVIFNRDSWQCQDCLMGIEEHIKRWNKTFDIHHIDGNGIYSKKPNNDPDNLITLCCSCHCSRDNKLKPKIKPGYRKKVSEDKYRYPELRMLVREKATGTSSVKEAKKMIAKDMGVSFWTIESKYYERKKCALRDNGE